MVKEISRDMINMMILLSCGDDIEFTWQVLGVLAGTAIWKGMKTKASYLVVNGSFVWAMVGLFGPAN